MVACVVVVSAADASNRRRCCTHLTSSATTATAAAAAASLCCGAASQLVLPSVGIGVVVGDSSSSAPPHPPPPPHRRSSAQSSCGAGGNGDGDSISVVPTTNRVVYNSNCSTNSSSMMTPSATALLCHHHHGTAAAATDPAAGLGSGPGPSPSQSQSQSQGSGQNSNSSCCTCSTNPTTATTTTIECVDQLKQQIRRAIDNSQLDEANEVLSELEKCSITKEILEATRVGAVVNDIRKRMQETSPALSKRCRALIKCWQKLLSGDQRPTSSCGSTHSNSVTPNAALSSPVVRHRGLTPGTPKRGGRLASCTAFSTGSLSALTSPAVGVTTSPASSSSYAPHPGGTSQHRVSPRNGATPGVLANASSSSANHMHKSYTSVDLLKKSLEENGDKLNKLLLAEKCNDLVKNGKRKLDEVQQSGVKVTALTNGLGGKDENAAISQKRVKISAAAAGGSSSGGSSSKAGSRSGSGLGSSPLASFHVSGGGGSSTSPDKTPSVSPPSKASSSSHNGSGAHHHNHAPATPIASAASSHAHQKTLSEARKANVQSTSDLVAELSENLPKYMAINLLERENQLRKEMQQQQHGADAAEMQQSSSSTQLHHAQHGHHGLGLHAAASSPSISSLDQQQQARKKETRGRPPKNKQQTVQTKSTENIKAEPLSEEGTANSQLSRIKEEESGEDKAHLIWTSMLPTLDNLRHREHFHATPSNDPSKSYIINARGRQVIALPYLDTGLPDFVEFNYPEAYKFYSEENFIYGADRPL